MEYGGFEGIIPKGQYGGGTVMVWDQGTWEPQAISADVDAALRAGSLKFILHGDKLKGKWALIRMGGKAANEKKPNWLLIKEHDEFERQSDDPAVTEAEPNSVVTGRDIDQIAHSEDHVWNSKDTAKGKAWYRNDNLPVAEEKSAAKKSGAIPKPKYSSRLTAALSKAPKEELPTFIPPELAQSATDPPRIAGWLHELKLDGYRIQVRKDGPRVRLLTRTGLDWTHRMRPIAQQVKDIAAESAILDGEVVVLNEDGTTSFADLQAAFQEGANKPLTSWPTGPAPKRCAIWSCPRRPEPGCSPWWTSWRPWSKRCGPRRSSRPRVRSSSTGRCPKASMSRGSPRGPGGSWDGWPSVRWPSRTSTTWAHSMRPSSASGASASTAPSPGRGA